jgi:hypothetical protein
LPIKAHEVLINLRSFKFSIPTLNCNRIRLLDILSLMCKIATDCTIIKFAAHHILEGDIIRQEEVLVAVADIQAAAEGQIMSSCLWNSNPT